MKALALALVLHCVGDHAGWEQVEATLKLNGTQAHSRLKLGPWYMTLPTTWAMNGEDHEVRISLSNGGLTYFLPPELVSGEVKEIEVEVETDFDGHLEQSQALCKTN